MKKAPILGIVAVLLVGLVAVGAFAFPFGGKGQRDLFPGNDAAKDALAAGDYDAFVSAVEDSERMQKVSLTEEQFNEMVERHNEMEEKRVAVQEQHAAVDAAIEAGDYAAWKEAISGLGHESELAEKITEENFGVFVEMHNKLEEAKALAEELGIERPGLGLGQERGPGGREGMAKGRMDSGMGHRMGSFGPRMNTE